MHSTVGPWVEANQIFIAQSDLDRRILKEGRHRPTRPLVIYDVGLGIAANSLAALAAIENLSGSRRSVEIYSFERYPEALIQALGATRNFSFLAPHQKMLRELIDTGSTQRAGLSWNLISGDFRGRDLGELPAADLVYFDFYAPAVCPELWTYEVFSQLRPKMATDDPIGSLLITYASTKAIRSALLLAGFFVGDGATTKMKRETTVAAACLQTLKHPLKRSWLDRLDRSKKQLPCDWPESRREEALGIIRAHPQFQS